MILTIEIVVVVMLTVTWMAGMVTVILMMRRL